MQTTGLCLLESLALDHLISPIINRVIIKHFGVLLQNKVNQVKDAFFLKEYQCIYSSELIIASRTAIITKINKSRRCMFKLSTSKVKTVCKKLCVHAHGLMSIVQVESFYPSVGSQVLLVAQFKRLFLLFLPIVPSEQTEALPAAQKPASSLQRHSNKVKCGVFCCPGR